MAQNNLNSPILVTGIERSGSSIVAKIISMCGAHTGPVTEMQENKKMKLVLNKYYEDNHWDARGQFPLPENVVAQDTAHWIYHFDCILDKEGYNTELPWMYKSSRIAQIWPVWHSAYPKARWIIVRRRTGDILHSCIKTGFMSAYANQAVLQKINVQNEAEGWLWWVHKQEANFVNMINSNLNIKVVWPERMASGDFEQMKETIAWLGLEWDKKVEETIRPMLKNSKQKERQ